MNIVLKANMQEMIDETLAGSDDIHCTLFADDGSFVVLGWNLADRVDVVLMGYDAANPTVNIVERNMTVECGKLVLASSVLDQAVEAARDMYPGYLVGRGGHHMRVEAGAMMDNPFKGWMVFGTDSGECANVRVGDMNGIVPAVGSWSDYGVGNQDKIAEAVAQINLPRHQVGEPVETMLNQGVRMGRVLAVRQGFVLGEFYWPGTRCGVDYSTYRAWRDNEDVDESRPISRKELSRSRRWAGVEINKKW